MDPAKQSLLHVNNGGGNESHMEELFPDALEDPESEWTPAAADTSNHHKGAADKHKFGTRRTRQKVVTDIATVSKGTSAGGKPRAALRQALFSQGGSDKNPPSEERAQLGALKQALQAFAVPVSLRWRWRHQFQGTELEKNWTDLVQSHSTLAKSQRHQQEALWEFVHTELTYINKLMIIKDLVIAALVNLHQHGFLLEVAPEQLFSNLPSILSAHQLFWQEVVFPMLHAVRSTGRPFDPLMLQAGCLQFHERFKSYKRYCWEEDDNLDFTRRHMENDPQFQTYVQWVETHPQCDRMRLGDMQAKPHQRITKYPLLLKAVLRSTQEPRAQRTLRGMLSSVNMFLVSINDYLRLKDEELALSISAQRVEGYELEGIGEEIDKHVKEICQFDLTVPISGVGPSVVRQLLLEGNLKLRGRKDNKLEVVALLFSDVLLMTKAPKKGERLKVVRPPLALDRTHCVTLKDGCSFVLVEVGELHCAMTVYTFTASTAESCSEWISSIQHAKETLRSLRKEEAKRQLETWRMRQLEAQEAEEEDSETENASLTDSECGMSETTGADEVTTDSNGSALPQAANSKPQSMESWHRFADSQLETKGYERMKMATKEDQWENEMDPSNATAGRQVILVEDLPDVDYPTNEDSVLRPSHQASSWEEMELSARTRRRNSDSPSVAHDGRRNSDSPSVAHDGRRNSDSPSVAHDGRRNSTHSESGDIDRRWLSKNLLSPGLRRKKPVNSLHIPWAQTSNQGSTETLAASHHSSSSNNDSDYDLNTKTNSVPPGRSLDSHRVLKLGSLKPNQGMFWRIHNDSQTKFESELSGLNSNYSMSSQGGNIIPNMRTEGGDGRQLPSSSTSASPQEHDTDTSPQTPSANPSILEGLLERAKDRVRERNGPKQDKHLKGSGYPPVSPSFYTPPSPSATDGEQETEGVEKEVKLIRHRAATVSDRWREQLVDEDDGVIILDGVNVDWSGWCFDDDEVMYHLGSEGLLEDINRSLTFSTIRRVSVQDDRQCSQV